MKSSTQRKNTLPIRIKQTLVLLKGSIAIKLFRLDKIVPPCLHFGTDFIHLMERNENNQGLRRSYATPFDKTQLEVLRKIVLYAGIENLIKLLIPTSHSFLDENPNFKSTINNVIESSRPQYNNRILNPEQLEDYLDDDETFFDKRDLQLLKTPEDFVTMYNYCVNQKISVVISLAYLIMSLADEELLEEIATQLEPGGDVKLTLDLDGNGKDGTEHVLRLFFTYRICKWIVCWSEVWQCQKD